MNRSIAIVLATASLFATTAVAAEIGNVAAQEEPGPPVTDPPATASGTIELELVDQSFDLAPDGDIELVYRLTGDLASVTDLSPPTTTTTTTVASPTSTTTTTATTTGDATSTEASSPTTTLPAPIPLTVRVLNYTAIADPVELAGLLGPDPRSSRFPQVIDGVDFLDARTLFDVDSSDAATLRLTVPTDAAPSVSERLEFDDDGIHPILVQVRVDDQVVARHGTVIERRSSAITAPPPIDLALIAAIAEPAPTAPEAAFATAAEDFDELLDVAAAIDTPIALDVPPSVAAAVADSTNGTELDADASDVLRREEVLAAPATPFNVSSASAVDRVDAFVRQLNAGERDVRRLLGVLATRDLWLTNEPLSAEGAQVLRDLSIRYLAMPADVYAATVAADVVDAELPARDRFIELDLPDGSTIATLLIDDETGASFATDRTVEILAEQTPTEWVVETITQWRLEQYAAPRTERRDRRSRLVSAPDLAAFDPTLVNALETFAPRTDAFRFASPSALASITDTQDRPDGAALPDTAGPSLETRLDRITQVEADLADTASMLVDDERPAQWARRLDSFVSTAFSDADVNAQLDELVADAARIRNGVVPPEPFTFTLTGREEQRINLGVGNTLAEPVRVLLRLTSPRLLFPDGDVVVLLAADDTTVIDVAVIARSNGTSSVTVEVLTPDAGRALIEPVVLTSRVNSLTGIGQVLTGALVLILATWWISNWRSRRREEADDAIAGTAPARAAAGTPPSTQLE